MTVRNLDSVKFFCETASKELDGRHRWNVTSLKIGTLRYTVSFVCYVCKKKGEVSGSVLDDLYRAAWTNARPRIINTLFGERRNGTT